MVLPTISIVSIPGATSLMRAFPPNYPAKQALTRVLVIAARVMVVAAVDSDRPSCVRRITDIVIANMSVGSATSF